VALQSGRTPLTAADWNAAVANPVSRTTTDAGVVDSGGAASRCAAIVVHGATAGRALLRRFPVTCSGLAYAGDA